MADGWGALPDDGLEAQLQALGASVEWPRAPDLASRVAARLGTTRPNGRRAWWSSMRPVRRALVIAATLVLLLAAGAAALTLLLPGLRLVTLPPGETLPPVATGSASSGSGLGSSLGLGTAVEPADAAGIVGFDPLVADEAAVGPADETYVAGDRITALWRASDTLPETEAPGVGLVVTQFEGRVEAGWYEKIVQVGGTDVEEVSVGGRRGWWVSGDPHQLVYRDPSGRLVEETRRVVGDVLIWRRDGKTLRIESALGREATVRLAETFAPAR